MESKESWDSYFMRLVKIISSRSCDPNTKHGCIIINDKHRIISTGYNGPIQGIDDSVVPLTRPHKYFWLLHAEENAEAFCKESMEGGTVYITGFPCNRCFRTLAQRGVKRIVYGDVKSKCLDPIECEETFKIALQCNLKLEEFK